MASFTLGSDSRFHVGDTINCYAAGGGLTPSSPTPVTSSTVAADSTTSFTGLNDGGRYLAGKTLAGPFVSFQTDSAVEQSGSVDYVANDGLLPTSATGHPVMLVLEDSQADGQASLRYWSGTEWLLLGLAGGGTVSGDLIDLGDNVNLSGILAGYTAIWNGTQLRPGALS